jgi:hypothetical protein
MLGRRYAVNEGHYIAANGLKALGKWRKTAANACP